jgi:hypothetical protein
MKGDHLRQEYSGLAAHVREVSHYSGDPVIRPLIEREAILHIVTGCTARYGAGPAIPLRNKEVIASRVGDANQRAVVIALWMLTLLARHEVSLDSCQEDCTVFLEKVGTNGG